MTGAVLDASALLTFLLAEPGAEAVARRLRHASLSAVNYSETLTKCVDRGKPLAAAVIDIARLRLAVVPFDAEQAAVAASLRAVTRSLGLSFADRACLALALSRNLPAVTADRVWTQLDAGITIECVR